MKLNDITGFICGRCRGWQRCLRGRCVKCGRKVMAGDPCVHDTASSHLYDCYRPPRPRSMTPVEYYRKYKCVDASFRNVTNGRYYCNPAHCSRSWTDKAERDKHLRMAYAILG